MPNRRSVRLAQPQPSGSSAHNHPAGRLRSVASRALASRVQVALATHPETRRYRISVEAEDGVVVLEGTSALERAVEVARGVTGVMQVKTQQVDIPPIPPFVA